MIEKKSTKGDIEKKRTSFLLIGLVVILGLVYAGFELFATADQINDLSIQDEEAIIIMDDQTKATDQAPPPPPPVEQQQEQILEIVDNNVIVDSDVDFLVDFDQNEIIADYTPVEIIQDEGSEPPPVRFVEQMPEFPGGMDAFNAYLKRELRYPEQCRQIGITGVVLVEFVVERNGSISNVKVLVPVYPDLDAEAIRVISASPKWNPGKQMGKAVRVFYQIPIRFSLN
ncbi:MAG TPA: energy transducer TonB [Bacteroidales bacterium]|jgi:protein TonB|nr:energy transducer TonB [Bacteroidales bacterium]HPE39460.1 energy transducer TonB [Bacteroidales bacterium]